MEQTGVKVKGLRELTKAMQQIGVPKEAIKDAGKLAAQRVVNEAKTLVPVRTGKLRDSIRVGATAAGKVTIRAGNNGSIPYANPIHWGWYKRNIKPQPFFAKALGYTRDEIYQTYFAQLEKHVTEQTAKARIVND
jgi:HK97 gp10 family phage protein